MLLVQTEFQTVTSLTLLMFLSGYDYEVQYTVLSALLRSNRINTELNPLSEAIRRSS